MADQPAATVIEPAEQQATIPSSTQGCVMLVKSGEGGDIQWFEYRSPGDYYGDLVRIEWATADDMHAVLPNEIADYLIRNKYARPMTVSEVEAYNASLVKEAAPAPEPAPRKKKGEF